MTKRVVPPLDRFGGVGEIKKRLRGSQLIYDNRDALAEALMGLFAVKITDIVDWKDGKVVVKNPETIPEHALAAIKKITVRPSAAGDQLEVELIDKLRVANMLAKSAGLLDPEKEIDKPSVLNIEMVMPKDKDKKNE